MHFVAGNYLVDNVDDPVAGNVIAITDGSFSGGQTPVQVTQQRHPFAVQSLPAVRREPIASESGTAHVFSKQKQKSNISTRNS